MPAMTWRKSCQTDDHACRCIVTTSRYTSGESFESADAIYDCIGDAGEERFSLTDLAPAAASEETVNA